MFFPPRVRVCTGISWHLYIVLHLPGHTITIKRASKLLVNACKLQTERDKVSAENQEKIIGILEDIQSSLTRLTSNLVMKKKIDISNYFPINNDAGVAKFLDKSDGLFLEKRDEFEHLLFCHVTKNLKLKRSFEANFLSIVFTRDFISSHRWPGPRYQTCKI